MLDQKAGQAKEVRQLEQDGTVKEIIMAYVQKNNPIPKTACGRRRLSAMGNPFKSKAKLKKVVKELRGAVKAHGEQADAVEEHIEKSPMKGKKDACYHKVKGRVKVWPSAYASGQLVQCRKAGAANWGTKSKK